MKDSTKHLIIALIVAIIVFTWGYQFGHIDVAISEERLELSKINTQECLDGWNETIQTIIEYKPIIAECEEMRDVGSACDYIDAINNGDIVYYKLTETQCKILAEENN